MSNAKQNETIANFVATIAEDGAQTVALETSGGTYLVLAVPKPSNHLPHGLSIQWEKISPTLERQYGIVADLTISAKRADLFVDDAAKPWQVRFGAPKSGRGFCGLVGAYLKTPIAEVEHMAKRAGDAPKVGDQINPTKDARKAAKKAAKKAEKEAAFQRAVAAAVAAATADLAPSDPITADEFEAVSGISLEDEAKRAKKAAKKRAKKARKEAAAILATVPTVDLAVSTVAELQANLIDLGSDSSNRPPARRFAENMKAAGIWLGSGISGRTTGPSVAKQVGRAALAGETLATILASQS